MDVVFQWSAVCAGCYNVIVLKIGGAFEVLQGVCLYVLSTKSNAVDCTSQPRPASRTILFAFSVSPSSTHTATMARRSSARIRAKQSTTPQVTSTPTSTSCETC
jgi:hypothetical protein